MFYIWGISEGDSGEEILLETYLKGKYILVLPQSTEISKSSHTMLKQKS